MNARSAMGLVAAGFLAAGASAEAQTLTNSINLSLPPTLTDWSNTFALPKFDAASGTLLSVVLQATEGLNVSGLVSNAGPSTVSFALQAGSLLTVTLPNNLGSLQPVALAPQLSQSALAAGGTVGYGPYFGVTGTGAMTLTGANLNAFIGTGVIQLPVFTRNDGIFTSASANAVLELTTSAYAGLEVEYVYVPEPGSGVLFLTGSTFILWVCRRRRP